MSKKLISAMIAGMSGVALAQSNVTIYGVADVSIQGKSASSGTAGQGVQVNGSKAEVQSNTSMLGFRGTEDLGNGLKALFQIETFVNLTGAMTGAAGSPPNGSPAFNNGTTFGGMRDSFVAISGAPGTLKMGYLSTPYRAALAPYDIFPDGSGDARIDTIFTTTKLGNGNSVGGSATTNVLTQSAFIRTTGINYALPKNAWGINGSIGYSGSNNNGSTNALNATNPYTNANSIFGVSLGWSGYGVSVSSAFQQQKIVTGVATTSTSNAGLISGASNYLLAASYTGIPGLKVAAAYNRSLINFNSSSTVAAAQGVSNGVWFGTSYRFGNNEPRFVYANTGNTSGLSVAYSGTQVGQNGASQYGFGWAYYLSKRTQVYGIVSQINNRANGIYDFSNAPFNNSSTTVLNGGNTMRTYGAGMRMNF